MGLEWLRLLFRKVLHVARLICTGRRLSQECRKTSDSTRVNDDLVLALYNLSWNTGIEYFGSSWM